ncbi:MAG: FAD-dependent oxidoreductase [Gammaproteobacteria bacterium]
MTTSSGDHFTILGAGLAGSLAAIYLARRGARVAVYERRDDPRLTHVDGGRSINLALANRGIRALREVGLYKDIQALTIPMRGRMLHETGEPAVLQPYGKDESEVIYSISRGGLNALLLNRAEENGVNIHFGWSTQAIDLDAGVVTVADTAGATQEIEAGPVIAADGAGSVVRQTMAKRPGMDNDEQMSTHGYKELTIPPDGDGNFKLDPNALHVWPRGGFMMIALPNLDRSFTVTLFMAHDGDDSFAQLETRDDVQRFFEKHFADAMELFDDLTGEYFENPVGQMGTVRCAPWHVDGRALLIGDAAHAIVPFHGQGMNCAFEDCYELDRCLAQTEGQDHAALFALFEQRRRPNANAIADMAIENYIEMRASVRDPYFHLKKQLAFELERRYPAQFVPRYSMVMFHHVPYAEAQRRGVIQQEILDILLRDQDRDAPLGDINFDHARVLIQERLDGSVAV